MTFSVEHIGSVGEDAKGFFVSLLPAYREALEGLEDFGYIQLLWWFDRCDNPRDRGTLTEEQPYKKGPKRLGVFATRSPSRPNPIGVSVCYATYVDKGQGLIRLAYTDAFPGTPVLDIKPYTPSLDRVDDPPMPKWCAHWPQSIEESEDFDWEAEFNF